MFFVLKIIWMGAIVLSIFSILWFLLGSTANFQRPLDLINTFTIIYGWIPSIVLVIVSARLLTKGWTPTNGLAYGKLFLMIALQIVLSVSLIKDVSIKGWLIEEITSDSLKVTKDKEYEYRIDLVNLFQKNSSARLYVRNITTGKESLIHLDIHVNKIHGIVTGEYDWVIMEPSDVPERYNVYTTKKLTIPEEKFEIDIGAGTSRRLK